MLSSDLSLVHAVSVCNFALFILMFLGINYKTTTLLLDGKRIKLQLW